jgi:hypothetical protein
MSHPTAILTQTLPLLQLPLLCNIATTTIMQDVAAQVAKLRAKRTRLRSDHDTLSGARARADAAAARSGVRGLVRAAMAVLPKASKSGDSSDSDTENDGAVRGVLAADTGDELSVTAKV